MSVAGPGSGFLFAQTDAEEDFAMEEITVTGSRIARDSFTSAAPMQVFDAEEVKKLGITSVSELLQKSTIANGQQFNGELNSNSGNSNASEAPAVGGVGSANISLRGLGPERTLVLINGRRLGTSGVRGAPSQPDINLLPLNMVERIEVITEGASSIYGADAVAGVVNVILRNNFQGLELTGNVEIPADGGEQWQASFITGAETDRASFVVSGEFFRRNRLTAGDRYDCPRLTEEDEQGNKTSLCFNGFFDNSAYSFDSYDHGPWVWWTPGSSDIDVPNWSSSSSAAPDPTPPGASERADDRNRVFFLPEYSDWDERLGSDLVTPVERFSVVALGDYKTDFFGGDNELYFESYYFNRQVSSRATHEQIFPTVPGMIPKEDADGNLIVNTDGTPVLFDNPDNPFDNGGVPIITLDDVPQVREVELQHFRFVGGYRGDFTGNDWLTDHNFSWDITASYDRGTGFESRQILNETNLQITLETLRLGADGNLKCGLDNNDAFGLVTPATCAPTNFFTPSLYATGANGEGTFETDADREWLVGTRTNRTVVEQSMFTAYVTGDLWDIKSGDTVGFAGGLEWRKDTISSAADFLGARGGIAAENPLTEGETVGSRDFFEAYMEFNIPVITGRPGIELLSFEVAGRYTDESNFGSEPTGRFRVLYQPNDWITLSASYGTSYRAPNLREQFLADQFSGVGGDSDPCAIPDAANVGGIYDPSLDTRSQTVMDNCVQSGADPTVLGIVASTTIPVTVGGNPEDLVPETSDTWTASLRMKPDIGENWSLDLAVSYFDITIEDTVRSIAATVIMTRCYEDAPGLASPFCPRLERAGTAADPAFNFISSVDASFVNIGEETARGFDINTRLIGDVGSWTMDWSNALTIQTKRTLTIFAEDPAEDLLGDFGVPKTRWNSRLAFSRGHWEMSWLLRYLSSTHASDVAAIDAECGIYTDSTEIAGTTPTASVCDASAGWFNDFSVTYFADTWTVSAGVKNIFDEKPPLVDMDAGSNRLGRLTSSGYDQFGRSFFLTGTKSF